MQNTFGICVQGCLWSLSSLMLNTVKRVLPWQLNFEKKIALTVDTQRNVKILDSLPLR